MIEQPIPQNMSYFDIYKPQTDKIFVIITFLAKPILYLLSESNAAAEYLPTYSYMKDVTSQLGVPYEYKNPETGESTHSKDARGMNTTFFTNGVHEMTGHFALTSVIGKDRFSSERIALAVAYEIGMILLAAVPGGPKEREHWTIVFHGIGALLALGCGNLNSIVVGVAASKIQPIYRWLSIVCGTTGLLGILAFATLSTKNTRGFWQRTSIYSKVAWEFVTVWTLVWNYFHLTDVEIYQVKA